MTIMLLDLNLLNGTVYCLQAYAAPVSDISKAEPHTGAQIEDREEEQEEEQTEEQTEEEPVDLEGLKDFSPLDYAKPYNVPEDSMDIMQSILKSLYLLLAVIISVGAVLSCIVGGMKLMMSSKNKEEVVNAVAAKLAAFVCFGCIIPLIAIIGEVIKALMML